MSDVGSPSVNGSDQEDAAEKQLDATMNGNHESEEDGDLFGDEDEAPQDDARYGS